MYFLNCLNTLAIKVDMKSSFLVIIWPLSNWLYSPGKLRRVQRGKPPFSEPPRGPIYRNSLFLLQQVIRSLSPGNWVRDNNVVVVSFWSIQGQSRTKGHRNYTRINEAYMFPLQNEKALSLLPVPIDTMCACLFLVSLKNYYPSGRQKVLCRRIKNRRRQIQAFKLNNN